MDGNPFDIQAEAISRNFHLIFERYHPSHGQILSDRSKVKWEDVPWESKALIIAVFKKLMIDDVIQPGKNLGEIDDGND